jgi:putative glutamine amidotransferase
MRIVLTVDGDSGDTAPYDDALRQVGIEAVRGTSLKGLSGLLLMGGTDVNPARYGEVRRAETEEPDDPRDLLECRLIEEALALDLPILAICRGMQILNVQHGGTLFQHIEGHVQETGDKSLNAHPVAIVAGTRLAGVVGDERCEVNSRHHQAVGRVGTGLVVSARDPVDGVIEGIERADRKFVVGVQWHPENQMGGSVSRRIFEGFAEAVGRSQEPE